MSVKPWQGLGFCSGFCIMCGFLSSFLRALGLTSAGVLLAIALLLEFFLDKLKKKKEKEEEPWNHNDI